MFVISRFCCEWSKWEINAEKNGRKSLTQVTLLGEKKMQILSAFCCSSSSIGGGVNRNGYEAKRSNTRNGGENSSRFAAFREQKRNRRYFFSLFKVRVESFFFSRTSLAYLLLYIFWRIIACNMCISEKKIASTRERKLHRISWNKAKKK